MKVHKNGKLVQVIINGARYCITNDSPTTPPEENPITSLEIQNKISSMIQGNNHQLQVNILPIDATDKNLTYSSSNTNIATVSNTGLVTAIGVGNCTIDVKSSNNISDSMSLTIEVQQVENIDVNKTPYIATYRYDYVTSNESDVIIPFYITDKEQVEYMNDDDTLLFDVRVEFDGEVSYMRNVKAGDHTFNFGKKTPGEHWFSLQVTDKRDGVESNRLYNDILIKTVDDLTITPTQTYTVTDADLTRHNINKNNSQVVQDMINNRVGLTALFTEVKNNGYKKCVIPQGTYRVNRTIRLGVGTETPIDIPSQFTVDFNNSTIKLHPYSDSEYPQADGGKPPNIMVRMKACYDSHILNGVFEGDYFERKTNGWLSGLNGEANNTLILYGTKFCTIENITLKQTTGYTVWSSEYGSRKLDIPKTSWKNVNIVNGIEVEENKKFSSDFIDISTLLTVDKYVYFGKYLGYAGMNGESFIIDIHFYDSNKTYIKTIRGHEYRKTKIVDNTKYVRVTYNSSSMGSSILSCYTLKVPNYTVFKDIHSIDTRTCAFAPAQFNNMVLDNCDFTRSGIDYSITPMCIDLEDGWENMQDFFIHGCKVLETVGTRTFKTCAGLNMHVDSCDKFAVFMEGRTLGCTIKNNTNMELLEIGRGQHRFNSYSRLEDNSIIGSIIAGGGYGEKTIKVIKNCNVTLATSNNVLSTEWLNDGNVRDYYIGGLILRDCTVRGLRGNGYLVEKSNITTGSPLNNGNIRNCTVVSNEGTTTNTYSFNGETSNRLHSGNTHMAKVNYYALWFNYGTFENEVFKEDVTISIMENGISNKIGDIQFNNCIFEKNVTFKINKPIYVQMNGCTFLGTKSYVYNCQDKVEFNNCIG